MQEVHKGLFRAAAPLGWLALAGTLGLAGGPAAWAAGGGAMVEASAYHDGGVYAGVPAPAPGQAQVVVYRGPAARTAPRIASVYVDRQLHTALLPERFTRLCVAPGGHSIEAYFDDAPLYRGKHAPRTRVELAGGATYYVRVDEGGADLVPVTLDAARAGLAAAREQRHLESRAAAVQPCRGDEAAAGTAGPATPATSVPSAAAPG